MCGCHGYSPKHLRELSFEQCYDDGEADAGWDQVEQGGLWTDGRAESDKQRTLFINVSLVTR